MFSVQLSLIVLWINDLCLFKLSPIKTLATTGTEVLSLPFHGYFTPWAHWVGAVHLKQANLRHRHRRPVCQLNSGGICPTQCFPPTAVSAPETALRSAAALTWAGQIPPEWYPTAGALSGAVPAPCCLTSERWGQFPACRPGAPPF